MPPVLRISTSFGLKLRPMTQTIGAIQITASSSPAASVTRSPRLRPRSKLRMVSAVLPAREPHLAEGRDQHQREQHLRRRGGEAELQVTETGLVDELHDRARSVVGAAAGDQQRLSEQ